MKRDERVVAVKISSTRRKAAQKFWAPQQGHPDPYGTTLPALRATSPYTGEAFSLAPLRKRKSPQRHQWRMQQGDFEEVPRLAATTVAVSRLARRWAGWHGEAVTEGSTVPHLLRAPVGATLAVTCPTATLVDPRRGRCPHRPAPPHSMQPVRRGRRPRRPVFRTPCHA